MGYGKGGVREMFEVMIYKKEYVDVRRFFYERDAKKFWSVAVQSLGDGEKAEYAQVEIGGKFKDRKVLKVA